MSKNAKPNKNVNYGVEKSQFLDECISVIDTPDQFLSCKMAFGISHLN